MPIKLAPLIALFMSAAILGVGSGLLSTLVPFQALKASFSPSWIGSIGSAYFGGFIAGCILGPQIVKRVGHIRAFSAFSAIVSASVLLHATTLSPHIWLLVRFISGASIAAIFLIIESWLNDRASDETRAKVLSLYAIISFVGLMAGQQLLSFANESFFIAFALVSALLSLSMVPITLTKFPPPAAIEVIGLRLGWLYRTAPTAVLGCVGVGLTNGAFWALAPIYCLKSGYTASMTSAFLTMVLLGGAVLQWPLGALSDRFDRRKLLATNCGIASFFGFLLAFYPAEEFKLILLLAAAYGAFSFTLYALFVAHGNDRAKPEHYVEIGSGLLIVFSASAVIGPVLSSFLMEMAGSKALFLFTALAHLATMLLTLLGIINRKPVPEERREDFVPITDTVPTAYDLHPAVDLEENES
jgi:MFS family permease